MAAVSRQNTLEVSTVENDNGIVIVGQETKFELGQPRDTTIRAFIRNTYPARYNHVVRNMNRLTYDPNAKKKRQIRGGHFFLYRYIISLAILLSFCFGIASIYVKACCAVPFILTTLYIVLSIINIVIYISNKSLLHPVITRQVPRDALGDYINRFYNVPLNARVVTGVVAAYIDPAVIAAALRRDDIQLAEIRVMLYDDQYLSRSRLPKEIITHLIIFIILFILAIIFVSITVKKQNIRSHSIFLKY